MADFSKNLKRLRLERGMNQNQLAEKMNVTRQTISSWERGNSYPDIGSLTHLAEVLGVEVQVLLCPPGRKSRGKGELTALSPKFLVWSLVFYFLLHRYGFYYIAYPIINTYWTLNVHDERFANIYWDIFLAIAFVGLCTCIITEYIANAVEILSTDREGGE